MNPSLAIAPPPALRRRRALRAEPLIFAVLLNLLTLGINLAGDTRHIERADTAVESSQVALAR